MAPQQDDEQDDDDEDDADEDVARPLARSSLVGRRRRLPNLPRPQRSGGLSFGLPLRHRSTPLIPRESEGSGRRAARSVRQPPAAYPPPTRFRSQQCLYQRETVGCTTEGERRRTVGGGGGGPSPSRDGVVA